LVNQIKILRETDPDPNDALRELSPSIDSAIFLDRSTDWITPMLTQLTYEGLIDESFEIKSCELSISTCNFRLALMISLFCTSQRRFARLRDYFSDTWCCRCPSSRVVSAQEAPLQQRVRSAIRGPSRSKLSGRPTQA
jgi:hypothetical protein